RRLFLTGHSMGGALATLAAARLDSIGAHISGVYTFGSPRVGDRAFAQAYHKRLGHVTYRYRNNNDVFTLLPPAAPAWLRSLCKLRRVPGGYRHVGRLMYFDHCGKFHEDPGLWERIVDAAQGRLADLGTWGTDGVKDHAIKRYVELCAAA
ncbi:MAG: alpha/beta fold hydrolase, partial [Planctomycetaceae bacterium]